MRVLGIDPGSQITGVGIIDCAKGIDASQHVYSESVRLPKGALPLRLGAIYQLSLIHI